MEGTIIFSVVGRTHYGFDIFSVPLPPQQFNPHGSVSPSPLLDQPSSFIPSESLLTDGISVNFNGSFACKQGEEEETLIYVSERSGAPKLYIKEGHGSQVSIGPLFDEKRKERAAATAAEEEEEDEGKISHLFFDRPILNRKEGEVYFVATQRSRPSCLRKSWAGVYCGSVSGAFPIRKLTPPNVTDLSPSLSPCGKWVAVASYQNRGGWGGEVQDLHTDIYVFRSSDGFLRRKVVSNGAWPSWAPSSNDDDDNHDRDHESYSLFFHRKCDDGWWSIYKKALTLPRAHETIVVENNIDLDRDHDRDHDLVLPRLDDDDDDDDGVPEQRVTPPSVHAFTPAPSLSGHWVAVATHRPRSKFRHIEIFDLSSEAFIPITSKLNPEKHHYNPFVSSSGVLGYHRCRDVNPELRHVVGTMGDLDGEYGGGNGRFHTNVVSPSQVHRLEAIECPLAGLSLVRIDGFFPSVSPCGRFIAYNKSLPSPASGRSVGLYVMRSDGSKAWNVSNEGLFYTSWDPVREGVIYCVSGAIFAPASANVQVVALHLSVASFTDDVDQVPSEMQVLSNVGTGNNAFPAPSPDGKWLVFRSGRGGAGPGTSKNLYIMDAEHGEKEEVRRLTCGDWIDTMPSWSPDGEWIAFSSTMDSIEGSESFALYMVRPDGTDLHKVSFESNVSGACDFVEGRVNHVQFSPDSRHIVFTADLAGVSAEPISLPNQFQPYGEIFVSRPDGSNLVRLTHNAYEDGTPTWASTTVKLHRHELPFGGPPFVASSGSEPLRGDFSEPLWLDGGR